jgi:hypothetical protein
MNIKIVKVSPKSFAVGVLLSNIREMDKCPSIRIPSLKHRIVFFARKIQVQ